MILTCQQGSQEWLDIRKYCVSATDAPSIMHRAKLIKYPYAKAGIATHIKSKVTPTPQNFAMAKGQAYEPIIMAELLRENPILDNLIIQVGECMASYDAVDIFSGMIREIKTSSTTIDKIKLLIPGYVMQLVHQAYVLSLHGSILPQDMDCKIVLLQFIGTESAWHIVNVSIANLYVSYDCQTLGLTGRIDINMDLWSKLCDQFHVELMRFHLSEKDEELKQK